MYKTHRLLLMLAFVLFIGSCDVNTTSAKRSGTVNDDYISEPLSNEVKKYSAVLNTSNQLIELIKAEKYKVIYDLYVDDSIKSVITKELFEKVYVDAVEAMGNIVEYKEMQWGFLPASDEKYNYIYSYKIVIHEKGRIDYSFAFIDNGNYKKIMGFAIKPRNKARLSNEI